MLRLPAAAALAATTALVAAPALATASDKPARMTAKGIGPIRIGATVASLRAAGLIGRVTPGCELESPRGSGARVKGPFTGTVVFDHTGHVTAVTATRGAIDARGVKVGDTAASVLRAYPKAHYDRAKPTDPIPYGTIWIGKGERIRFSFLIDASTKKVVELDVPLPQICE